MPGDPFSGVPAFVAVAEEGSFTRAAAALGVTPAGVSQAISRMEDALGSKLFDRTTRSLELTGEGRLYLDYCRTALEAIETGRDLVEQAKQATEGELVVALSHVLGPLLASLLPEFLRRYPKLDVRLVLSDRMSRLVDEQIDIALRIGHLRDSSVVAKKLMETHWVLVAAPSYLKERGTPRTPDDLRDHDCLVYRSTRGFEVDWELLRRPGTDETRTAQRGTRLVVDQGNFIVDAALGGAGLGMVFSFMVESHLESGQLVPVLASYVTQGPPIHALVKPGSQSTAKVRVFLDYLAQKMR